MEAPKQRPSKIMAHSSFPPAVIKAPLKDARKNLIKAIKIEKAREDKEENKWLPFYRSRLYYPLSDEYLDTLREISKINTLARNTLKDVSLTADEYIMIKYWAEWKE